MFDSFRFTVVSLVDKCLCYAIEQNVIFGCSLFFQNGELFWFGLLLCKFSNFFYVKIELTIKHGLYFCLV